MRLPGQHKLTGLQEGLASSRKLSTGIFGALRSSDFVIDHNYIGVLADGNKSSIRIIIENFQLISFTIYGEMDRKVNTEKLSRFIFNVAQWRGQKAYIEILPGSFENHIFKMAMDAHVEAKYAIAYNREWFEPKNNQQSSGSRCFQPYIVKYVFFAVSSIRHDRTDGKILF